jgi:hypothetical protein
MKRLADYWKANLGGKIIIILSALIVVCLSCMGIILIIPSSVLSEPTTDVGAIQTRAFETVLASVPMSPTAPAPEATSTITLTSAPTFTDIPVEDYPRVASSRFQTFKEALMEFAQIHSEFTADITLSQRDDWYAHTSATLFRVTAGADELAGMNNYPPEYQAFHNEMIAMSEQGKLLSDNYTLALDHQDMTALNNATANLSAMITHTNQAGAQINSLAPTPT